MPRSAGPYGRVVVSAGDMARFAELHLDDGRTPDGTRVLSAQGVDAMQPVPAGTAARACATSSSTA